MAKLDVGLWVDNKTLSSLLLLILPLALLKMSLHDNPLQVLDCFLCDCFLLCVLLLIQLDKAKKLRVELADDLQLRCGEADVIVHRGNVFSN